MYVDLWDFVTVLASMHTCLMASFFSSPVVWDADNADLYSKVGVPFVMGTTGGDRERLYKTVEDSKIYAVISPQMGKQVFWILLPLMEF